MRQIKTDERRLGRNRRVREDSLRGLRVAVDVEFGPGGLVAEPVALAKRLAELGGDGGEGCAFEGTHGAPHDGEAGDVGGDFGVRGEEERDVGAGPRGDEPGGIRRRSEEDVAGGEEEGGRAVDVGSGRWAEGRAAEAGRAVDVGRVDFGAAEGLAGAGVDGDVGAAEGGEDAGGVVRGVDEGRVAVAGADAEEGQGGVVRGDEDCEDVLWASGC